jgi:hypothetical protein
MIYIFAGGWMCHCLLLLALSFTLFLPLYLLVCAVAPVNILLLPSVSAMAMGAVEVMLGTVVSL